MIHLFILSLYRAYFALCVDAVHRHHVVVEHHKDEHAALACTLLNAHFLGIHAGERAMALFDGISNGSRT